MASAFCFEPKQETEVGTTMNQKPSSTFDADDPAFLPPSDTDEEFEDFDFDFDEEFEEEFDGEYGAVQDD